MSSVWIQDGGVVVQNDTLVVRSDSGACCDDCPVLYCAWSTSRDPLSDTYTLTLEGVAGDYENDGDTDPTACDTAGGVSYCGGTLYPDRTHGQGHCTFSGTSSNSCTGGSDATDPYVCTDAKFSIPMDWQTALCNWAGDVADPNETRCDTDTGAPNEYMMSVDPDGVTLEMVDESGTLKWKVTVVITGRYACTIIAKRDYNPASPSPSGSYTALTVTGTSAGIGDWTSIGCTTSPNVTSCIKINTFSLT